MNLEIFIQIIWYIAIVFSILWFSAKKDKNAIILVSLFNLFMWFHLLLLGALAWAYSLFFDIAKNMFSLKYKNNLYTLSFFTCITLIIAFFTYNGTFISLLPALAPIVWTVWIFLFSWVHLRFIFLTCSVLWIIYNLFIGSIPWMLSSFINIISIFVGIWRIRKQQKYAK